MKYLVLDRMDPLLVICCTTLPQYLMILLIITGGDNRQYILTGLTPYTNYTVTVRAYNDAGIGSTSNETIHQLIPSIHSSTLIISSSINIIKTMNNEKTSLIILGTTSVIPLSKQLII